MNALNLQKIRYALNAQGIEDADNSLSEFIRSVKADAWDAGADRQARWGGTRPILQANPYRDREDSPVVADDQPMLELDFGVQS